MIGADWRTTSIEGADALINWFNCWPSFHDAEIVELHLSRRDNSWLKLDTWITDEELDSDGRYLRKRRAIVTIEFRDISDLDLQGFSRQNVIAGLEFRQTDKHIEVIMLDCFGLSGSIKASRLAIAVETAK